MRTLCDGAVTRFGRSLCMWAVSGFGRPLCIWAATGFGRPLCMRAMTEFGRALCMWAMTGFGRPLCIWAATGFGRPLCIWAMTGFGRTSGREDKYPSYPGGVAAQLGYLPRFGVLGTNIRVIQAEWPHNSVICHDSGFWGQISELSKGSGRTTRLFATIRGSGDKYDVNRSTDPR